MPSPLSQFLAFLENLPFGSTPSSYLPLLLNPPTDHKAFRPLRRRRDSFVIKMAVWVSDVPQATQYKQLPRPLVLRTGDFFHAEMFFYCVLGLKYTRTQDMNTGYSHISRPADLESGLPAPSPFFLN